MKSFINPANPLLFDVEGNFKQSTYIETSKFFPLWAKNDIVYSKFPEQAGAGNLMTVVGTTEFDPFARSSTPPYTFNFTDPARTYAVQPTIPGFAKFQYIHPSGKVFITPTYRIVEDPCVLERTILIRYWNDGILEGGTEYPDIDYLNGSYKPSIRVYGSLNKDGRISNRTFNTSSKGNSFLCRADSVPAWRLTIGPAPEWLHDKLESIFLHQHIEVQKYGSNRWIPLVPYADYQIETQVLNARNSFVGSGRLVSESYGILTT